MYNSDNLKIWEIAVFLEEYKLPKVDKKTWIGPALWKDADLLFEKVLGLVLVAMKKEKNPKQTYTFYL